MEEKIKQALGSKVILKVIYVVGGVLVVLLIFSAGMAVGFHQALFGRAWGDHYNENFGIGRRDLGTPGSNMMGYFPNANGANGKIIKITLPSVIVEDKDGTEKVVLVDDDTQIEKIRQEIMPSDLQVDDFIVVVGSPNDQGQITAKLIRVLPNPELLNQ